VSDGPLLELDAVTLAYDGIPAVRGLTLSLAPGEVLALLGPNGAGKSSTLNACAGFLPAHDGQIWFDGRPLTGQSPQRLARLGVSHVPEGRGVFHGLTVEEHFRLAGRGSGIDQALGYFPALGELRGRRAGLLSGGEQQMLALATALVREPRLLLIDELSLGLAPIIVERLLPVVRSFADDSGCAVVLVEQHVHLALEVADRAVVLAHGEKVLEGEADSLIQNRELIMASYLGQRTLDQAVQ
jgi:branched-chain amino acid transport system ATP-binding protein